MSETKVHTAMKILTFLSLTFFWIAGAFSQPNYPSNPEEARLVFTDVEHFVEAWQSLEEKTDTLNVIQELYIDRATPGLNEYINRFGLDAASIQMAIRKYPEKYSKIASFLETMETWQPEYTLLMKEFNKVLSNAMFAPTYLLVADYKGIGQASRFGQLVSVEKRLSTDLKSLKNTIVHELTHFQQAMTMGIERYTGIYTKKDNMLDVILREGGADFITHSLVRKNVEAFTKLNNYMAKELHWWKKFLKDLETDDEDFWVNVSFNDNNKGNPIQLGYAVGFKIVESYYNRMDDKQRALQDILDIGDARAFFKASDYQPANDLE